MARYVGLLRAVNVGGTTTLAMADLKTICADAGLTRIATYIASGNVVFDTAASAASVRAELEARLQSHTGRPVGVILRTAAELAAVLDGNPFADKPARFTVAIFLDRHPAADALAHATGHDDETMRLGRREIYVHYPRGMGRSKLKIPDAQQGTARNMNTIAKLVEMTRRD